MRIKFHSLALIIFVALTGFEEPAFAMRITSVHVPQNRDQQETQQGLPTEKKRALSKYGPEDVFSDQEMNDARQPRSRRKSQSAPVSSPSPTPTPKRSVTPAATPTPQPAEAIPSPTITVAALDNQAQQPPLAQPPPPAQPPPLAQLPPPIRVLSKWTVPILSSLALVVFVALIYVLNKLRVLLW